MPELGRPVLFLVAGLAAVAVVVFATWGEPRRANLPDPGVYDLPTTQTEIVATQTLRLNIAGQRIEHLHLRDVDVGFSTSGPVFLITADPGKTIRVGTTTISGITCPKLTITSSANNGIVQDNRADGNSFTFTIATTTPEIVLGSERGMAQIPTIEGSSYDRIIIDGGAGGAVINRITIEDSRFFGGVCTIEDVLEAGTIEVSGNTVGDGTGIGVASLTVSLTIKDLTESGNTEEPISVQ